MKHQNDNRSPGAETGEKLVPSCNNRSKLRHTTIQQFSRGNQRIREVVPVPDSSRKSYVLHTVDAYSTCALRRVEEAASRTTGFLVLMLSFIKPMGLFEFKVILSIC